MLIAAPDIVIETRDRSPTAAQSANQPLVRANQAAQDAALLALASSSTATSSALDTKLKSTERSLDEESWEDLLGALASDQDQNM